MQNHSISADVDRLLAALPKGRENAISINELLDQFEVSPDEFKEIINTAYHAGFPLIRYGGGVFLPKDKDEWSFILAVRKAAANQEKRKYQFTLRMAKSSGCFTGSGKEGEGDYDREKGKSD